jgi:hypothetical protein
VTAGPVWLAGGGSAGLCPVALAAALRCRRGLEVAASRLSPPTIVTANEPRLATDPPSAKDPHCGGTYKSGLFGMYCDTHRMPTPVRSPGKLPPPSPAGWSGW